MKDELGIIHPITSEHFPKTSAVEACIMSDQRKCLRAVRRILEKALKEFRTVSIEAGK